MKLFTLILVTSLHLTYFAQNKPLNQEIKAVNPNVNQKSTETQQISTEKEFKNNDPQSLSSPKSKSENTPVSPVIKHDKFVPIPATQHTDSNYEKNLTKSKLQEDKLNTSELPAAKELSTDQRIENYKIAREKYSKNSVEYNQISEKINYLISNK